MTLIKLINFDVIEDHRGSLVSLEQYKNIPFDIKRIYYIYNTPANIERGFHAHKALQQVAVCIKGGCKFKLTDGKKVEIVSLDNPNIGLFINDMTWREMYDFSADCILMVLASEHYNEDDYIRSFDEFLKVLKND